DDRARLTGRSRELSSCRLAGVADLVLLHLAVERRSVQAKYLRGLLLIPVRALQRLEDRHLFALSQRAVRRNDEIHGARRLLANRFRKIGDGDLGALRHEHGALDGILELAHVAGPAVADQQVVDRRREGFHIALIALAESIEKIVAEQRNILGSLA